jgi:hypothetical protein
MSERYSDVVWFAHNIEPSQKETCGVEPKSVLHVPPGVQTVLSSFASSKQSHFPTSLTFVVMTRWLWRQIRIRLEMMLEERKKLKLRAQESLQGFVTEVPEIEFDE